MSVLIFPYPFRLHFCPVAIHILDQVHGGVSGKQVDVLLPAILLYQECAQTVYAWKYLTMLFGTLHDLVQNKRANAIHDAIRHGFKNDTV